MLNKTQGQSFPWLHGRKMFEKLWKLLVVLSHSEDQSQITSWFTEALWEMKRQEEIRSNTWSTSEWSRHHVGFVWGHHYLHMLINSHHKLVHTVTPCRHWGMRHVITAEWKMQPDCCLIWFWNANEVSKAGEKNVYIQNQLRWIGQQGLSEDLV